jgi:hypothetical protein
LLSLEVHASDVTRAVDLFIATNTPGALADLLVGDAEFRAARKIKPPSHSADDDFIG